MDGIYVTEDGRLVRPRSKKAVKEAVVADASTVFVEWTSLHSGRDGTLTRVSDLDSELAGLGVSFVGPNPFSDRRFYGSLTRGKGGQVKVS